MGHALCRCWAASGGTPELVDADRETDRETERQAELVEADDPAGAPGNGSERETMRNMELDPEKVDVELLVERCAFLPNSRCPARTHSHILIAYRMFG
jgi:hypothetical protein